MVSKAPEHSCGTSLEGEELSGEGRRGEVGTMERRRRYYAGLDRTASFTGGISRRSPVFTTFFFFLACERPFWDGKSENWRHTGRFFGLQRTAVTLAGGHKSLGLNKKKKKDGMRRASQLGNHFWFHC